MEGVVTQQVVGDAEHEHAHGGIVHSHDRYHVSHQHAGGLLGEFEHRSHYHYHYHDHDDAPTGEA